MKTDKIEYYKIDKEIRKVCQKVKEKHLKEQFAVIKDLEKKTPRLMHEKLKETKNRRRICSAASCVEAKDGTIVIEKEEMLERWEEYIKELFEENRESVITISREKENLPFRKDEVEKVSNSMPKNKLTGPGDVAIELIQAMDDLGVEWRTTTVSKIYDEGYFPLDMRRSTFIALPKKSGTAKFELHSTISLMSHIIQANL